MTDEQLVMVDKAKLRELRDRHREMMEVARTDDSLASAWMLLGVQAAVLDTLLTEIINGNGDG